jgi:hypothetical protein
MRLIRLEGKSLSTMKEGAWEVEVTLEEGEEDIIIDEVVREAEVWAELQDSFVLAQCLEEVE